MRMQTNVEAPQTRLAQRVQARDEIAGLRQILCCLVPEVDWEAQDATDLLRRAKAVLAKEFQRVPADG